MRELPERIFELTPSWLSQVSAIARRSGVRLVLDLSLLTATPSNAARWARTAESKLPQGSIIAFEIGNEPDIYGRASRQNPTSGGRGSRTLPRNISATSYAKAFGSYARALGRAVRECRSTRRPWRNQRINLSWVSKLLASSHPGLSAVTAHRYRISLARDRPLELSRRSLGCLARAPLPAWRAAYGVRW